MSTNAPHTPGEFGEPPVRANTGPGVGYYAYRAVKALASLQLTVVLFVLGMLLIFFGTMAQIDNGIWTVVNTYFYYDKDRLPNSLVVWVPFELFHKFLTVFWKEQFPANESAWTGTFPFPCGFLIGLLMLVNLLAAHATRFRISWKRSGIFLIHGGILLLLVGEFITREYAVEQRMTIEEGKSANFTEDPRHVEFVFVDKSDPGADSVVSISERRLKNPHGRITHPDLPVDVEVVGEFMVNSALEKAKSGLSNPADSGLGKMWIATPKAEVSGLSERDINYPAVYLKFYKKGTDEVVGTYLGSLFVNFAGGGDELDVNGKKYEMALRFKRYYKPFRVHLNKFRFDRYTGTEKAKNYSSDVRIQDENGNDLFPAHIAMNEPLRYNGETFYQQSFDKSETTTVLQVVKNPGMMSFFGLFYFSIDYLACGLVGVGLLAHFGIFLLQFLTRGARKPAATTEALATADAPVAASVSPFVRYLPWVVLGVMALYLLSVFGRMGPPKEPVDYDAAARMPVVDGGRVKPLDTVARVNLRMISGREEYQDEAGNTQPAIRWYLEVLAGGSVNTRGPVWDYRVFRIDNEMVLNDLKLEKRAGFRYSLKEIGPKIDVLQKRMGEIEKKVQSGKKLDTDETKFKELRDRIQTFLELAAFGGPLLLPPQNGQDWETIHDFRMKSENEGLTVAILDTQKRLAEAKLLDKPTPEIEKKAVQATHGADITKAKLEPAERAEVVKESIDQLKQLLATNPRESARSLRDRMKDRGVQVHQILTTLNNALREQYEQLSGLLPDEQKKEVEALNKTTLAKELATRPANATWDKLLTAYRAKNAGDFAAAVAEYRTVDAAEISSKDRARARVELTFNRFAPFYQCTGLYVIAFILSVIGFTQHAAQRPQWGEALRKSATYLLVFTFVIHALALLARMYIMDRPLVFVTNLYSSAIFIGLGCVGLGLLLERIFKIGVGNVLAAILGLSTTIVAHNIATEDTLEMMQAVLDTNFWLATHVTTVTLGYTATFVAGFLGALYVFQMLGAVIRDSYEMKGEPTVGALLAFGAAATGAVGIPLFFLWFMTSALAKFEVLPSILLWGLFALAVAAGVMYAVALMLLRVSSAGTDAHGKPLAGQIPGIAKPVVALALTPERSKVFGQMVYGVVCFATLLSFVGTVLGGIWADQSWGRFWGWDPKENGAVLIVLWNSLILHARWAGLVKDRGVAVLAIFGNVMTAWSWFGTNQLSIGLHAYGFDSRLADGCANFWVSQLFILAWGLIPRHFWASASKRAATPTAPVSAPVAGAAQLPAETKAPTSTNGVNGHANGQSRRDKKKQGKRR